MVDQEPVIADLPTGEAVPSGEPEPAQSQQPPPPAQPPQQPQPPSQSQPQPAKKQPSASSSLAARLAAGPSNMDAFLTRLSRCMSTPAGIDAILMFVGYSSRLAAELLDAAGRSAIHATAHRLITLAFSLPPRTAILLSSAPAARANPLASLALTLATRLRALAALLSEGRVFMRSWALLSMYLWGRRLVLSLVRPAVSEKGAENKKTGQALDNTIACTQFVSLLIFQSLENVYFLGSKGVLPVTPAQQGKALRWSTRAWAVYVGVELGRLFIERRRKNSEDAADVSSEEHKAWRQGWQRSVVRNLAWAPLTVHWSLEKGFLNDLTTWSIAYIPAVIAGRNVWRENA
ncbi:hypothetical protein ACRALDRAFT_1065377 [Sodiomyces alcalophilus JCM 7366]|uniref:uncharacterized protein n=1 Tax=Sodiomyces alcalophilus JCM 7366 TaxID=591952 RepID=UPI0039B54555